MVLDVGGARRRRPPRRRACGRSRTGDGQPVRAGVVGEHPAHRVVHREHPPAAGPQHPGDLAHHPLRVGHERHRAERRAGQVEGRRRRTAAARRRPARAARRRPCAGASAAAWRSIPRREVEATGRAPCRRSQRAHGAEPQPTSRTRRAGDVAEQARVVLRAGPRGTRRSRRRRVARRVRPGSRRRRRPTRRGWRAATRRRRPAGARSRPCRDAARRSGRPPVARLARVSAAQCRREIVTRPRPARTRVAQAIVARVAWIVAHVVNVRLLASASPCRLRAIDDHSVTVL